MQNEAVKAFMDNQHLCSLTWGHSRMRSPPKLISPTFQFVEYSEVTTDGNAGGPDGMNEICQKDYGPTARMCTSKEWWTTHHMVPVEFDRVAWAWVHPSTVTTFQGPTYATTVDWTGLHTLLISQVDPGIGITCDLWSTPRPRQTGLAIRVNLGGYLIQRSCALEAHVACCVPAEILKIGSP